jgi:Cu+-exporting ATPase
VGITFAAKGLLSPIVAAILMPISSISVIVFTVSAVNIVARMKKL